jgi:3'-phosphoadenosine 5'-phosphosulfate sulfotransferase (PAPS reductase)/FAD synthetase
MTPRNLQVKQRESDPADWTRTLDHQRQLLQQPDYQQQVEQLVERTAEQLQRDLTALGASRIAYGWSGGKDSQVLQVVCETAGIHECILAITDLEYPAFLAWATDHMPHGLSIVRRPWDLDWLAGHRDMLFPASSGTASRWFSGVQHWGQRRYCRERDIEVLIQGRRRADGNYISPDGQPHYRDRRGFIRHSPLADWTHEQVLAVIAHYGIDLAPCYRWPRGFQVGTGSWPARQWCRDEEHGWSEVWTIDPNVVITAAQRLPGAASYLDKRH